MTSEDENPDELRPVTPRIGPQYAAVPCSEVDGKLHVLLVTSRETRRWVIPKGWAEPNLSPEALAAKEAYEEAGAVGEVERASIGAYQYRKRLKDGRQIEVEVGVFRMRVHHLLDEWPEAGERERCWFPAELAARLVQEQSLATLLRRLQG
ncbi:NUDIX hydrolase [Muricoccus radiodurans]|uniref:NUDIX hydrolase n=1 Tax=Muricoccus radiodurans TaxID=2231721 RepID=UPI003CF3EDA5